MSNSRKWAFSLALILTLGLSLVAAQEPVGLSRADEIQDIQLVPRVAAPSVNLQEVAAEDVERDLAGLAPRFAIPNRVAITPDTDGVWENLGDGNLIWRLRIGSPGAVSLNLGFSEYLMSDHGSMQIYAADGSQLRRPFTAEDNELHGELWTPIVTSDEIVVEVVLPATERDDLYLKLTSLNVGYRGFGPDTLSGSCNVDVVCADGDDWREEIPAIAVISTGGSLFCTGFMVNNTAQDATPYFMTAYHCGISSSAAASLVAYWNYETSTCSGSRDGQLNQWQSGSFFRAQYSPSDFTLVELDSDPDPAWGITFAGWDRSGADATTAVAIHHPSVDEKAISFEFQSTTTTTYLNNSVPGNGTHVRVTDWDIGTTEGGSSGSPLFDQDHRVIGQLHGGYAACGNNTSDWYGKFSVSWTGGGSAGARLSDWLDAGATGASWVDTLVPGGCSNNGDCADGVFCNGAETCSGSSCQPGSDPCPGQACDEGSDSCVPLVCDMDSLCESGEDCNNCSGDCDGSAGAQCNNGICEPGEDCASCPEDCRGKLNGNPNRKFCCGGDVGGGSGPNPIDCSDSRCSADVWECSPTASAFCCGNGACEAGEDAANCAIDCAVTCAGAGDCDDAVACTDDDCVGSACVFTANDSNCPDDGLFCNGSEVCGAVSDCTSTGDPCSSGSTCNESTDSCDSCVPKNASCSQNNECCSGTCKNNGRCR